MAKITITIPVPENATGRDAVNAVRRALDSIESFTPGTSEIIKGLKVIVRGNTPELKSSLSNVRDWARENGHAVGLRGRIAADVRAAYAAASKN
jgi:hypothetical protein